MLFDMTMNMKPVAQWDYMDIVMLFVMWAIMMAGMMLPSALPVVMLVDRMNQQRKSRHRPYTQTVYFVLGYLLCWAFYSLLITFVQWWLHLAAILSPMMVSANSFFSGVLLVVAGIYQWSPLKQRCLSLCRSPLSMITNQWKEGIWGAVSLGIKHGQYCLGCCWFLMALLFVTGVMNLKWILVLTLIVLLEKVIPKGEAVSKVLGVAFIFAGFMYIKEGLT
jgi:predicted metal-binding membrane protein